LFFSFAQTRIKIEGLLRAEPCPNYKYNPLRNLLILQGVNFSHPEDHPVLRKKISRAGDALENFCLMAGPRRKKPADVELERVSPDGA
jgi:hypothetical protein